MIEPFVMFITFSAGGQLWATGEIDYPSYSACWQQVYWVEKYLIKEWKRQNNKIVLDQVVEIVSSCQPKPQ